MKELYYSCRISLCLLSLFFVFAGYAQTSRTNNKSSNAYRSSYQRFNSGSVASHSFEIRNGTLWAWGRNITGNLGDGTTTRRSPAVQIGTATNWLSLASRGLSYGCP